LQGPVGILLDLLGGERAPVEHIRLSLSPYEAAYHGIDYAGPYASSIATKMSAQFSLGLAAVDGRVTLDGLDRVADPDVLAVARRVQVLSDPSLAPRQCRLSIQLADGQLLSGEVTRPVGRPDFAEISRFARDLAAEIGAGPAAIESLIEAVTTIETAPSLQALVEAVGRCVID
jgi:2-methylcitrate dehydratase PrpD